LAQLSTWNWSISSMLPVSALETIEYKSS
jgi:hypothetical protein